MSLIFNAGQSKSLLDHFFKKAPALQTLGDMLAKDYSPTKPAYMLLQGEDRWVVAPIKEEGPYSLTTAMPDSEPLVIKNITVLNAYGIGLWECPWAGLLIPGDTMTVTPPILATN